MPLTSEDIKLVGKLCDYQKTWKWYRWVHLFNGVAMIGSGVFTINIFYWVLDSNLEVKNILECCYLRSQHIVAPSGRNSSFYGMK